MICTEFYDGQGLGNQLWLYVNTRTRAADMNVDFGIKNPEKFKGFDFMQLDFGSQVYGGTGPEGGPPISLPKDVLHYYSESQKYHPETRQGITDYDSAFLQIRDKTKIDGNLQGERYISHRKNEIRDWLTVDLISSPVASLINDDLCVINFRGGEYRHMKDVFLPHSYWQNAKEEMLKINPHMQFKVVTDDPKIARKFFPKKEVLATTMGEDYLAINKAKYLILSNSSFAWFPAWLNPNLEFCIAPKYWWGFNKNEYWSCQYNMTSGWHYMDRDGKLSHYQDCLNEYTSLNSLLELPF